MQECAEAAGVDTKQGIPLGITRNRAGDAVLYYKGSQLEPKYLMEVSTIIGSPLTWDEIQDTYIELNKDSEYYRSFDWDSTPAGFVDIRRPDGKLYRYYLTLHQPSGEINWYRKIKAETKGGQFQEIWEKFDKENYDGIVEEQMEVINIKGELE